MVICYETMFLSDSVKDYLVQYKFFVGNTEILLSDPVKNS